MVKRVLQGFIASAILIALPCSGSVFAQGSIYGAIANSDHTVPADSEISFFGYLSDTDDEIRIEGAIGAGYEAGFWYDDFQNFQGEAPGDEYDFHFFSSVRGEGHVLSELVPDNSFEREDVALAPVAWPPPPTGLTGDAVTGSPIVLRWNGVAGLTFHIYRRVVPSAGSFFRIDAPDGSPANPGVADSIFVGTDSDEAHSYQYLMIAEDASGQLSPHSSILTVQYTSGCCVFRGDINHSGALPIDIGDLVYLVEYMFADGPQPACHAEADVNGDGAELIDIADLVYLVEFMFNEGPEPSPCP